MATNDAFTESWFIKPVARPRSNEREFLEQTQPPKARARIGWALGFGAFGGAVGGAFMLLAASAVARQHGFDRDVVEVVGREAGALLGSEFTSGLAVGSAVGAALGALLGLLTRYSLRLPSRLLTGGILAPVLWTLLHAFVFRPNPASAIGELPFGPMLLGAAAFGLCATILPPPAEPTAARARRAT